MAETENKFVKRVLESTSQKPLLVEEERIFQIFSGIYEHVAEISVQNCHGRNDLLIVCATFNAIYTIENEKNLRNEKINCSCQIQFQISFSELWQTFLR